MKRKLLFYASIASLLSLSSCQEKWDVYEPAETPPVVLTYEQELAVVNNYTEIDTVNYLYSVLITDSIMQAEHLTEANVVRIMKEIDKANKSIKKDIQDGTVTTLTLYNNKGFKSYTVNASSSINFEDEYLPASQMQTTTKANKWGMSFYAGNWYDSWVSFDASDHVTSEFYVSSCTGYWSVTFTCDTGTSSYGTNFSTHGSRYTSGGIKRFWWTTEEGNAPYRWIFTARGPVGGEASGGITFTNTY